MLFQLLTTTLLLLPTLASAIPLVSRADSTTPSAVDILLQLAPLSDTCSNAAQPLECRTAAQAAPFILAAFAKYQIYSCEAMAAILSLIAYETGDFKFNIHRFPGLVPGQGTRNMQSASYNYQYASTFPELKSQMASIGGSATSLSDVQKDAVMGLVLGDEYTWATAMWFYETQCTDAVKQGVLNGGKAGWEVYLTSCVGTSVDGRAAGWELARKAFGLSVV